MTVKKIFLSALIAFSVISTVTAKQHGAPVPQAALSPTGVAEQLVGTLEVIVGDPQPGSSQATQYRFYLKVDNGGTYELSLSPGLVTERTKFIHWSGQRVDIRAVNPAQIFKAKRPDQILTVSAIALAVTEQDSGKTKNRQSVQSTRLGTKPWVTIFCKFADEVTEPNRGSFYSEMYSNLPGGLDHYWRESSYDAMNLEGSASNLQWVDLPGTLESYMTETSEIGGETLPSPDLGLLFEDCTNAADDITDFSNGGVGYYGINMMFNVAAGCCAWGGGRTATLDGVSKRWGVTWLPPWSHNHSIMAHEMGHALGLPHSNNWDDDDDPYDNPWDVMSMSGSRSIVVQTYGKLGPHTNAYHKYDLGWISGDRLLVVSPETTISTTIDAMATAVTSNHRMAIIQINENAFFTVEARKRTGTYEATLPDDAVIIHEVVMGRSEPSWAVDSENPQAEPGQYEASMWRVGETFTNSTGDILVTVDAETTAGFEVTIENRGIKVSTPELDALTALYNSTDGGNWTNKANWLIGDPCSNLWFGVECGIGTVHALELTNNNLNGSIPATLNSLENLQRLSLGGNRLSGAIPASFGDLQNLEYLDLSRNQFSQPIPQTLANLHDLFWMDLSNNQLSGSVPEGLSSLTELYALLLNNNQLTGSIPTGFGSLAELRYLHLQDNQLNGSIPDSLGNMTALVQLILYGNNMTGTIPGNLGDLANLEYLYLHNNQLSGSIPAELGELSKLFALSLGDNPLQGSIPGELGNLSELEHLYLYNIGADGPIPAELGKLTILKTLALENNRLSGSIPATLGDLSNLQFLSFTNNRLSGSIPAELGDMSGLQQLGLDSNQLSGAIPKTISKLTNLTESYGLYLAWNALYNNDAELDEFLRAKTGSDNWEATTQTIAPHRLHVASLGLDSVTLAWDAIDYTENGGGYRVWYRLSADDSFLDGGITSDKNSTSHTVSGLQPGQTYVFMVTTETEPHGNNTNKVVSQPSYKVSTKPTDSTFQMNVGLNDAWYFPSTNGQGFFITVFPGLGLVSLSWFTYDTEKQAEDVTANLGESGHRWLNAVGAFSEGQAVLDISFASGGLFDTSTEVAEIVDGTIILTFTDCRNGTVEYDIPSINQQGTVPIQRVTADNTAWCEEIAGQTESQQITYLQKTGTGHVLSSSVPDPSTEALPLVDMNVGLNDAWYNPVTNGQGFFITVFPEIGYVVLSWFTYDTTRPAEGVTANIGEPGHRWFNAIGSYSGNQATLDISIASGGLFDSPDEVTEVYDGTIILNFSNCTSGTVEYDIPSINKTGLVPIQRVAGDNIALCESLISQ